MSMATRSDTQSPSLHVADRHDLIRVHGARVNNLKDVSIEIPKRRLTVFTGVSGSGKSSLVFGTIAAESQRLINETYSAFVQGFMPALARPEVDVLDGLTTAIIVDQQRMGADARSTVIAPLARTDGTLKANALGAPMCGCPSRLKRMRSIALASVAVPTVERTLAPIRSWSTMIAVVSPSSTSTSGRARVGMKPCTKAL
jgi:energy-coupling factor transporter ATP-binding protein EcfA2